KRLFTILNSIPACVYVTGLTSHEILFANESAKKEYGRELQGRKCWQFLCGQDGPCPDCPKRRLIAGEGDANKTIIAQRKNPGTGKWYFTQYRPIKWVDGTRVYLHVATDISDWKRSQEQRKQLESRLRQAQKMEAIGTLAGGVAHDFNNILAAVLGYSELALVYSQNGKKNDELIRKLIAAAERAKDLVQQILAFSRKTEPDLVPLDLNQLAEQTVELLERTLPKMIRIKKQLAPDLRYIRGDRSQLEQVLMNLSTNARDAMPEGGELLLKTENISLSEEECKDQIHLNPGDYAVLTVSDNGHGMNQETVKKIFDPFFTTKEVGAGTGLGLSTAYGVVKSHRGHITCQSQSQKGTSFQVFLPALPPDYQASHLDTQPPHIDTVPGGRELVLLVDDDQAIRDIGSQILGEFGYEVKTAADGEEAVEIYSQDPEGIAIVILDISMPGMGGQRCLKHLLDINPEAKIIIASGYAPDGLLEETLSSGAAGFVAKPFRAMEMLTKVREVLDKKESALN
ncbi:MAG: response regulator, partial [Desulfarculaceae bacterium]